MKRVGTTYPIVALKLLGGETSISCELCDWTYRGWPDKANLDIIIGLHQLKHSEEADQ